MHVFITQTGKYYQADKAKDPGDAKIEFPTIQMQTYLTEEELTPPEFGQIVKEKEIAKLKVE